MHSKLSVIIPCYNDAAFVEAAIRSVQQQSYNNWECIIVNDGSTDNSAHVIQTVIAGDARFIYKEIKNSGPAAARNTAIEIASGEFILPLDADDSISENYLEACVAAFEKNPSLKLVYGLEQHTAKQIKTPSPYSWQRLLFENMIHCCGMFKKEDWRNAGTYDEAMRNGFEDWEFWIRLINGSGEVLRIDAIQLTVRDKDASRTTRMNTAEQAAMRRHIYEKHATKYAAFFDDPISLYKQYEWYKQEFDAISKEPFHFAFSRLLKGTKA